MFFSERHHNRCTLKQLKAYMEDIQTEAHNVTDYFDGGFHLNPKKARLGCAVSYTKNEKLYRLRKNALVEELHTNDEAEYAALSLELQVLLHLDVPHLPVTLIVDAK